MRRETHATSPRAVIASWSAAVAALGSALAMAVVGQGVGAVAGGCGWIGASIPIDHQVWALVNQPVMNFSSLPSAGGYWLGSTVVPLLAALLLLTLRFRKPTLVGQLVLIQNVWWAAVLAGIWLALLDPVDGHLSRWLLLHRLPPTAVWAAPAASMVVCALASFRLLEVARAFRSDLGRARRVTTVVIHLVPPMTCWLAVVSVTGSSVPRAAAVAFVAPLAAAVAVAWFRYPPPYPRAIEAPSLSAIGIVIVSAALTVGAIWIAGRPLPEGRATGVLWGTPGSFNNIRPWIALSQNGPQGAEDL